MATSSAPWVTTKAVVAAVGTSVVPGVLIPDNCHTILLLNVGANVALYGLGSAPTALVDGTTGTQIPVGMGVTLAMGTRTDRGPMVEAVAAGTGFVYDALVGGTTVEIVYLCTLLADA